MLFPRLAPILAALALAGCANEPPAPVRIACDPAAPVLGCLLHGRASFYAASLQGARTAAGEAYDAAALTAAHRTLPFGSRIAVSNVDNGRMVVVRINDRGPFARGRALDLSRAAAEALDFVADGEADVEIRYLGGAG